MRRMYELLSVTPEEHKLFFSLGEQSARFGVIGHLRGDFGSGKQFYTTWWETQSHLKSDKFRTEFDNMINYLRDNPDHPVLKSRADMAEYCHAHPGQRITGAWHKDTYGFKIVSRDFSHYVKCFPLQGDYNFYVHNYDNSFLLPELAGKHELPGQCYSVMPSSGELILITRGEKGYFLSDSSKPDPEANRLFADTSNRLFGITKAQEEAMLAGSMFEWDVPAAQPWHYDEKGNPRVHRPTGKDRESR